MHPMNPNRPDETDPVAAPATPSLHAEGEELEASIAAERDRAPRRAPSLLARSREAIVRHPLAAVGAAFALGWACGRCTAR